MPAAALKNAKRITIGEYYQGWIERKLPPLVGLRVHATIQPFSHVPSSLDRRRGARGILSRIEDLRHRLHAKHGLGIKTVRNVIDGSLRAMFRDARKAGSEVAFPFGELEWPRRVVPGPDPFAEEERDRLLEYFLRKRRRLGRHQGRYQAKPHFPYYAFLFTLFYPGMRPSEAVALKVNRLTSQAVLSSLSVRGRSARRQRRRPPRPPA